MVLPAGFFRPDWRWAEACRFAEMPRHEADYLLTTADPYTVSAYKLRRAIDLRMSLGGELDSLSSAYQVWTQLKKLRTDVECLLLAGDDVNSISQFCRLSPDVVECFHALFFDVRDKLDSPALVEQLLFPEGVYSGVSARDVTGRMHRVAWLCGPVVVRDFVRPSRNVSDHVQAELSKAVVDLAYKQTILLAFTHASNNPEAATERLRILLQDARDAAKRGGSGNDLENALTGFLDNLPFAVAEPKAQVALPAREPRLRDYAGMQEALTHV